MYDSSENRLLKSKLPSKNSISFCNLITCLSLQSARYSALLFINIQVKLIISCKNKKKAKQIKIQTHSITNNNNNNNKKEN